MTRHEEIKNTLIKVYGHKRLALDECSLASLVHILKTEEYNRTQREEARIAAARKI